MDEAESLGMDVNQFKELSAMRSSHWIRNFEPWDLLKFPRSGTEWRLGLIFSERQFHDYDDDKYISEASATCIATQVVGPNIGFKSILKIRAQLVCFSDYLEYYYSNTGKS